MLAYGMQSNRVVHVSEVSSGLACACHCSVCNGTLIARKGSVRMHHFAHAAHCECQGAPETLLHYAAKLLTLSLPRIRVPEYSVLRDLRGIPIADAAAKSLIVRKAYCTVSSATLEPRLGAIIPDVVLSTDQGPIAVEIVVSHGVDRQKLRALRRLNLPALTVRLQPEHQWLTPDRLRAMLCDDESCKDWVFHPNQRDTERDWYKKRRGARRAIWKNRVADRQMDLQVFGRRLNLICRFEREVQCGRVVFEDRGLWLRFDVWATAVARTSGHYPSFEQYKETHEENNVNAEMAR
jgi:hypothetical protein